MNPNQQTEYDNGAETRPKLGVIQGGGETSEPRRGHLSEAAGDSGDSTGGSGPNLRALEGGGETSAPVRGHLSAVSGGGLQDKEESAGSLYNPTKEKKKRFLKNWSKKDKQKAGIAGGVIGVLMGGGLLGGTFLVGPLEVMHLAQRLHDAHFSQSESAGDGRVSKIYRFIRSGGNAGETRIGWLASKYKDKILGRLGGIGIVPEYGTANTYKGFSIDTAHESSPYKGMTPEDAAAAFEQKTGLKPTIGADGKLNVDATEFFLKQRKTQSSMLKLLGDSRVATWARTHVLGRFGLVRTWHPLHIADRKVTVNLTDFYNNKIKGFFSRDTKAPVAVDPSKASTTDANGKPIASTVATDPSAAATAIAAPSESSSLLKQLASSKGAKITGGVAAVSGLACALKAVDDGIADIRYAEVYKPMAQLGMNQMIMGQQVQIRQDTDPLEVQANAKAYTTTLPDGTTVDWSTAKSLMALAGVAGGIDWDAATKEAIKQGKPAWLDWTQNNKFMDGMCNTAVQLGVGVFSVAIGIISGETISTVAGLAVSMLAAPAAIAQASSLLSGVGIDTSKLVGPALGLGSDLGVLIGANSAATALAGVPLTNGQASENNSLVATSQREDYNQKNFFARMFDPNDYRSLTASVIDSSSTSLTQNIGSIFRGVLNVGSSIAKIPASLYSATAHADTAPSYDYGIPQVGFSQADLNNPLVEDPYANADAVAKLLDTDPSNITRAKACFGVDINKDANNMWQVVPQTDVNVYSDAYSANNCSDGGTNWLRIRFFIFDSGMMDGFACVQLDDGDSCSNDGVGSGQSATDSTTPSAGSTTADLTTTANYDSCNKVASGNAKIVCSAYLFDALQYSQSGPRGSANWGFIDCVKTNFAGSGCSKYPAGSQRTVDCSSLVSFAIYDAIKVDIGAYNTGAMLSSSHLKLIANEEAQPGDIILENTGGSGHTEVIVSNDKANKRFFTYGAHTHYASDPAKDVSAAGFTYGQRGMKAYRVVP